MNKFFFFICLFVPFISWAQSGDYLLKSKVGNLGTPAKAYLIYNVNGADQIDSVAIKNGAFEFKGQLQEPVQAAVLVDHQGVGLANLTRESADFLSFYLEKGAISINSADSVSKAKITGSVLNVENENLKTALVPVETKIKALVQEVEKSSPADQQSAEFKTKMDAQFQAIQDEQQLILKKFIKDHPKSLVSLQVIKMYGGRTPNFAELETMFNSLSSTVKNTMSGKALQSEIARNKINAIGTEALDFTQNDANGNPVSLSSFRGKFVLIDFWASWCGPCRQENPNLVNNYQRYKDKNFTILGVSLDKQKEAWLKAVADDQLAWTQVSDLQFWNNEVAKAYGVRSIPHNLLIDPSGKIIAKNLRGEELGQKLSEVLKD